MKAMVLTKMRPVNVRPLTLEDIETPQPGPGQIRVKVNVCGVCGSSGPSSAASAAASWPAAASRALPEATQ
jgi:Zn-dependent alcohol dehydrogenase